MGLHTEISERGSYIDLGGGLWPFCCLNLQPAALVLLIHLTRPLLLHMFY